MIENINIPENYYPILIQVAVGVGFSAFAIISSMLLGPKVHGDVKDDVFECGVPYTGNARYPFSVKYFLTAILFVLFDIDIIFFYPYALNIRDFGVEGFIELLVFISIFILGFGYVLKKGALNWEDSREQDDY